MCSLFPPHNHQSDLQRRLYMPPDACSLNLLRFLTSFLLPPPPFYTEFFFFSCIPELTRTRFCPLLPGMPFLSPKTTTHTSFFPRSVLSSKKASRLFGLKLRACLLPFLPLFLFYPFCCLSFFVPKLPLFVFYRLL